MPILLVAVVVFALLAVAWRTYGRLLPKLFKLDDSNITPANTLRDDEDYIPTEPKFLLGQHFSAIAAAGPIVGPILAGIMFGWLPALLWILIGSIFIGGVHDMGSLVASIRHKAKSIAEVVREHMSTRAYVLFLSFIWLALVYIIVAFTDITAQSFVSNIPLDNGQQVLGAGIATSSLLYLLLPLAMGLTLKYTKIGLGWATAIFLPLLLLAIWGGQHIPLDLQALFGMDQISAHRTWDVFILLYCLVAAVVPMWALLQPRGHLGGYFLYFCIGVGVLGLVFGGREIQYPAFTSWVSTTGSTLAPFLFITIACGAVSGFHSLIASGTTSKQLRKESDARVIGYGTMLLEAGVAFIALSTVMMLAQGDPLLKQTPNMVFSKGLGGFLAQVGIPATLAISIMLMAFTTFVYDTLDVCTRLGRYIVQELTGWHNKKGALLGTAVTALVPLLFVMRKVTDATGKPIPAWRVFWDLFGASNQLLAALALLGITVWLWRTRRAAWVWAVSGLPCLFIYCMSCWALVAMVLKARAAGSFGPEAWVAVVLLFLAGWMMIEAIRCFMRPKGQEPALEPAPA